MLLATPVGQGGEPPRQPGSGPPPPAQVKLDLRLHTSLRPPFERAFPAFREVLEHLLLDADRADLLPATLSLQEPGAIELLLTFRPTALPLERQELRCLPAQGPRAALDLGLPLALQELVREYLEEVLSDALTDEQRQAVEEAVARMRQDIWVTYRKPGREAGYLTLRTESIRPQDQDTVSFAPALRVRVRDRLQEFRIAPPVPRPELAIAPARYEIPAGPEGEAESLLLDFFELRCR